MWSWQIIAASVVIATAISSLLIFFGGGLPATDALRIAFAEAHWPAVATMWLTIYGCAAAALVTSAQFFETAARAGDDPRYRFLSRYPGRLVVVQYFTSLVLLIAVWLSSVPIDSPPSALLPAQLPAAAAVLAVALAGLLGWLFLTAVTSFGAREASFSTGFSAEPQLARRDQPYRAQATAAPPTADVEQLIEAIERGQRVILESIKDLATAISHLGRSLREDLAETRNLVQEQLAELSIATNGPQPTGIENTAAQLQAAVTAIDGSVARLEEAAAALSVAGASSSPQHTTIGLETRSRAANELKALLDDMPPGARRQGPNSPAGDS